MMFRNSPAVVGIQDQDYRYRSVAIQIPHGDELAPIPYTRTVILNNNTFSAAHCGPRPATQLLASHPFVIQPVTITIPKWEF
jgi:hypothetical protein